MSRFANISQYWHTIRYLRPSQVFGRMWFKVYRPRLDLRATPARRRLVGTWSKTAHREPSLLSEDTFCFLGERGSVSDIGWEGGQRSLLWRYNQHYFDDLCAQGAASRRGWHEALISNWIDANPPGKGVGWDPYPTSLRIVNWVKWAAAGNELPAAGVQSLAIQAQWLRKRLEHHLLGNHLFSNAKALIFAGTFFEGDEAKRLQEVGFRLLARELSEQVLADGGHFERSTMYHALCLEDLLDLCNVCVAYDVSSEKLEQWVTVAKPMLAWLHAMSHPDGEISFFNDAAVGVAPPLYELVAYARRLGITSSPVEASQWFPESGYVVLVNEGVKAFVDVAPVGPDFLPGHAHADTLSFELSVDARRLFVNSGTSCYGISDERLRQRGTAAHNTVTVDNQNSSEVWSGFRVARRARICELSVELDSHASSVTGSHDGYRRLAGRPIHQRKITVIPGELIVRDRLSDRTVPAEARFHIHPDVSVDVLDHGRRGEFTLPTNRRVRWVSEQGPVRIEPGTWHPRFGVQISNQCIVLPLVNGEADFRVIWG